MSATTTPAATGAARTPGPPTSAPPARATLEGLAWPIERLPEALEALARRVGPPPARSEPLAPPRVDARNDQDDERLSRWVESAAVTLGTEAEPTEVTHGELPRFLRSGGPALLHIAGTGAPRFVALLGSRGTRMLVLAPDRGPRVVEREELCVAIRSSVEAPVAPEIDRLLAEVGVATSRRAPARAAFLAERLAPAPVGTAWMLRLPPGAGLWRRMLEAGTHRHVLALIGAHFVQYALWIVSWWMIGRAALEGHLDHGWLAAWGLVLLTLVPFRLVLDWSQGLFAIGAGGLLKQRLLHGAARLEVEEVRHQGAGQLLGRVIESEAVESLALSGGVLAVMAMLELLIAAVVLAAGAGGVAQALSLVVWMGGTLALGASYVRWRRRWTGSRLALTNDLVERMAGHRTRLAQEPPERWHEQEDQEVERYLRRSRAMDRAGALLVALVPRGWLVLGIVGLAPAFVTGRASAAELAIGLGGMLLATQALEKLASGLSHLAGAAIAWEQVAPLYRAAARPELHGSPAFAASGGAERGERSGAPPLIEASELTYRHRTRPEPVFRGVHLKIGHGERLLLEGPSGGGKSTLASLITGLRAPDSGLVLLDGLDRPTLGAEGWRRRVATAPQFHENHILSETLAFNLLMGRRWPPRPEDAEEAERVCRELGLGDLLDRMPSGLLQIVGDTGWQLSHGEKSRVFIARAILQDADLVVLDESFAALDPGTLEQSLRCVLQRAPTLMVIAHP